MSNAAIVCRLTAAQLSSHLIREVNGATRSAFSEGKQLLSSSSAPRMLERGWVVARQPVARGMQQVLRVYMPGDVIDDIAQEMPNARLVALTQASILDVPRSVAVSDEFAKFLLADRLMKGRQLVDHTLRLGRFDALQKMAHFLLEIEARWWGVHPGAQGSIPLGLTQTDMADFLALSPVHVNRTLTALRRTNLIEIGRGTLTLCDVTGLKAIAEGSASSVDAGDVQVSAMAASINMPIRDIPFVRSADEVEA